MRARLTLETGDCLPQSLDLWPGQLVTLGRSRDNTIVLRDELASRLHAKIYCEDGRWHLRDLGLNGTRVDGARVVGSVELTDGKRIKIGEVVLRFNVDVRTSPPRPVAAPTAPAAHTMPMRSSSHLLPDGVQNHAKTKVHEMPPERTLASGTEREHQHRIDELTALCRFMTQAVETRTSHELIGLALRSIVHQTTAKLAGYLGLDPDDPTPKMVVPESADVDVPLSRRLTKQAQAQGRTIWLFPDLTDAHPPTDSLSGFTDALCIPLRASGEPFAALHVYRSGRPFSERDVRFSEAVAGFLAHGLEIHRQRRTLEAENSRLRTHTPAADEILGSSSAVTHLRQQILRAAPQPFTVLIRGESGSGKELVALALHRNSRRADGPLVVVNCAAIAPTLLEAELFGYKKGAFSGAIHDHPGLFQQADEGTLFLDEVAELSLDCQAKLLRVIEGKGFRPVGATSEIKADVRIVAATNRDLEREVKAGRFREDLYFRLRVITISVPPLRDRVEDIPELANFFLAKVSAACRRNFRLSPAAVQKLQAYSWPGNVRQLRAAIESAAVMSESDLIDADALPLAGITELTRSRPVSPADVRVTTPAPAAGPGPASPVTPSRPATEPGSLPADFPNTLDLDEIETWAINRALRQTGGNVSHAARLLGMSRDTLHTKIKKKGIDRDAIVSTPAPVATTESLEGR